MTTALLIIFDKVMHEPLSLSQTGLKARFLCCSSRNSSSLYGEFGQTAKSQVST